MDCDLGAIFDVDHDDLREHFERDTDRGREYFHLPDERHGVERGTAVVDGVVVRGFPSIPRVLVLDPGIPDFFDGPVTVEEKLNGYNVRLAHVDGDVLAFTRSGYVCPFTTSLADDYPLATFFDDHPETVVCGELVGPANPYTTHDYEGVDDAALRVFDLRDRETGEPMPVDQRRERVVVKSADGTEAVKYTTSASHRSDLAHAFDKPFDYGRDFVFARVVREAFQAVEFEESDAEARERAREMGEAILLPAIESSRGVRAGETIGDDHTVSGDPAAIESLLNQFRSQGLHIETGRDTYEGDERVVQFTKVADSSRDKIDHYLSGGTVDE